MSSTPLSPVGRDWIARWREFQQTKLYDALAALPIILWYALSVANMVPALAHEIAQRDRADIDSRFIVSMLGSLAAILFISLALVLLVVRKTPKARAKGIAPRLCAFGGAFLMVSVVWLPQQPIGLVLSLLSLALIFGGISFSSFALLHLGRSFSLMAEARHLVTGGPYALIRHPIYLGEAISTLGLMLQYLSPLAIALVAVQLAFQFIRMKNEEQVLSDLFPEYQLYRLRTARLLPGLY